MINIGGHKIAKRLELGLRDDPLARLSDVDPLEPEAEKRDWWRPDHAQISFSRANSPGGGVSPGL